MRVALTGHRPQRLGLPDDETDEKWIPIQHWIIDELSNFIKTGGVWSTIRKAQKAGKKIIYCPKEILEGE